MRRKKKEKRARFYRTPAPVAAVSSTIHSEPTKTLVESTLSTDATTVDVFLGIKGCPDSRLHCPVGMAAPTRSTLSGHYLWRKPDARLAIAALGLGYLCDPDDSRVRHRQDPRSQSIGGLSCRRTAHRGVCQPPYKSHDFTAGDVHSAVLCGSTSALTPDGSRESLEDSQFWTAFWQPHTPPAFAGRTSWRSCSRRPSPCPNRLTYQSAVS